MTAIDWPAFGLVLVAALSAAAVTVALFAVGVRLLATPAPGAVPESEPDADDSDEDDPTTPTASRPAIATVGAFVAFALAASVAVVGVLLIVH